MDLIADLLASDSSVLWQTNLLVFICMVLLETDPSGCGPLGSMVLYGSLWFPYLIWLYGVMVLLTGKLYWKR